MRDPLTILLVVVPTLILAILVAALIGIHRSQNRKSIAGMTNKNGVITNSWVIMSFSALLIAMGGCGVLLCVFHKANSAGALFRVLGPSLALVVAGIAGLRSITKAGQSDR